jgi:hypothetical protein
MYKQITKAISKNSPAILTGAAITGVFATTALAIRATPKAMDLIAEEEIKLGGRLTRKETFLVTWKEYIPAAISAALTITCIVGSNRISSRRNLVLAGLYSASQKYISDYKGYVRKYTDDKTKTDIRREEQNVALKRNPVVEKEVIITGKGETLCYDALSGRYFKSDRESIKQALNKVSRDLLTENFITLNEVYSELGLKESKVGDMLGWHVDDGLIEAYFDSHLTEQGVPCLVMDFVSEPRQSPYA